MNVKLMIAALLEHLKSQEKMRAGLNRFNTGTPAKKIRGASRQSHSISEPKARRRMAQASNRINRQRIKRWKY